MALNEVHHRDLRYLDFLKETKNGTDSEFERTFSIHRKEILPKYRRVRAKPKWKKLSRKDGSNSRHAAWAQLLWRSFAVMGFVCTHCKRMMRLRAVAIYPPATTKILEGLGVNLHGLGFTGPP